MVVPITDLLIGIRLHAPAWLLSTDGPYGFLVAEDPEMYDDARERWALLEYEATRIAEQFNRERRGPERGWYGMACFNAFTPEQQDFLVREGYLPFGYKPEGKMGTACLNGAQVMVETMWDDMPGPRAYCVSCAVEYLQNHEYRH